MTRRARTARWTRWLLPLAAALLLPMLWAAPPARAQSPTTITMWLDTTGGPETPECIQKTAIDPFNAQNNGVKVDATLQANGWQATLTALQGGAGPDIVGTPGPSFAMQLALAGQLLPLDDFATQYNWSERFAKGSLNLGKADGKLYSIPNEVETLVLYYNKTLFEQHGWQPPKTIDELMTLSQKIQDAGIIPFAHANAEWRPTNEWFVGEMLNHVGGPQKVYDALTGKVKWTDPDFVKAIDLLNQMQQKKWFMGGLDRYYTTTIAEAEAAFGDGDAAMKIEGTWLMSDLPNYFGEKAGNNNDWGWVPMPSTTGAAIFDLGIGSTMSVNANSKNPDAVGKFMDYYFQPATMAKLLIDCGLEPAPVDLAGQDLSKLDPRHAEILAALDKAFADNQYGYTTWTFWPPEAENYLIENIEKVWAGEMTPEAYLAGHQQVFDKDRANGSVPPIPQR
ncbi:MAG TPA: extracellular solute-binding protein [Thermomicrobiales bacterium]|nr:extracellular solute-binding protein [Thermomicrobiales bacterium]